MAFFLGKRFAVASASALILGNLSGTNATECTLTGFYYNPPSMPGASKDIEISAEECQRRCNGTIACAHFAFWPNDGGCHLANESAILTKATCPEDIANCSGLYSITGPPNCDNAANFPDPASAVVGLPPPEYANGTVIETEEGGGGGFPIWGWLVGLVLLACIAVGVMYAMGLCGDEEKKKKKKSKKSKDAEAPDSEPLVAVPTAVEPVPMYTTAPVVMSPTYLMSPTYVAQAQPQVIVSGPQYVIPAQ